MLARAEGVLSATAALHRDRELLVEPFAARMRLPNGVADVQPRQRPVAGRSRRTRFEHQYVDARLTACNTTIGFVTTGAATTSTDGFARTAASGWNGGA